MSTVSQTYKAKSILPDKLIAQPKRVAMVLALFAFVLYANTLGHDYNMDDTLVMENHRLTSKGISAIGEIFTSPYYEDAAGYSYGYRPIVLTTFAIEYELFGDNPTAGHFINVFLYALTAAFLFLGLLYLFESYSPWIAVFTTLIFIVHPIHTEVVASIKNRDELLAFLFGFLAVWAAVRYQRTANMKDFVWFVLAFAASLMSKRSGLAFVGLIPLAQILFGPLSYKRAISTGFVVGVGAAIFAPFFFLMDKVYLASSISVLPAAASYFIKSPVDVLKTDAIKVRELSRSLVKQASERIAEHFKAFSHMLLEGAKTMIAAANSAFKILTDQISRLGRFIVSLIGSLGKMFGKTGALIARIAIAFYRVILAILEMNAVLGWAILMLPVRLVKPLPAILMKISKVSRSILRTVSNALGLFMKRLSKLLIEGMKLLTKSSRSLAVFMGKQLKLHAQNLTELLLSGISGKTISIKPLNALFFILIAYLLIGWSYQSESVIPLCFTIFLLTYVHISLVDWQKILWTIPVLTCAYLGYSTATPFLFLTLVIWLIGSATAMQGIYRYIMIGLFAVSSILVVDLSGFEFYQEIQIILIGGVALLIFAPATERKVWQYVQWLIAGFWLMITVSYLLSGSFATLFLLALFMSFLIPGIKDKAKQRLMLTVTLPLWASLLILPNGLDFSNKLNRTLEHPEIIYPFMFPETSAEDKKPEYDAGLYRVYSAQLTDLGAIPAPQITPGEGRRLEFIESPISYSEDPSVKLGSSIYVIGRYFGLLVLPHPLLFYYGYDYVSLKSMSDLVPISTALLIIVLIALSIYFIRTDKRLYSLGILWLLLGLFMFSNLLVPVAGIMGERLIYIASFGFCLCLGFGAFQLMEYIRIKKGVQAAKAVPIIIVAILLVASIKTIHRNTFWKDKLTLFRHDIQYVDASAQAHNLLATNVVVSSFETNNQQEQLALLQEALYHYKRSTEIYDDFLNTWYDMGRVYNMLGDPQNAAFAFSKAVPLDPEFTDARLMFARTLNELGRFDQASEQFAAALDLRPQDAAIYYDYSFARYQLGDFQGAIDINLQAREKFPNDIAPLLNIAKTYLAMQNWEKVEAYLQLAEQVQPGHPEIPMIRQQLNQSR